MSKAPRGRRVPPKTRGPRAARPAGDFDAIDAGIAGDATDAGATGALGAAGRESAEAAAARRTRAQNRAAKRAASGVRPKTVRGGPVRSKRGSNTPLIALAVAAVAVGAAVILLGNPFGSPGSSASPGASGSGASGSGASGSPGASGQVIGDGTCPTAEPAPLAAGESKLVTIKTEKGDIVIKVDGFLSPIAAGNFVALAGCKFYDGVVFHRTATLQSGTPFVIQGGDPLGTGGGGPGYTIADEPVATAYKRGTVAMARTQEPHSQGSQFFIVLSDESGPILQSANTYAIFGNVVSGIDVADAIYQASGGAELPTNPIAMTSVTVSEVPASPSPAASPAATVPASSPSTAP
jgi:peptidyl-prolyl cis-trans isomerase B (cyclophilin B)